ncbi:hypothetical protein MRX96_027798 [Rhipicephalus microplus]
MPPKQDSKKKTDTKGTAKKKEGSSGGKAKKKKWSKGKRLKVRGSLARKALEELLQKGLIKQVVKHHSQIIYTRTTKAEDA